MRRQDATKLLLSFLSEQPIVSNLGPTTDELWHLGDRNRNFYTYGGMGLCSSIALGVALSTGEKVVSLDGDGSLLMNLGTLGTIGREQPANLVVVVWDNERWSQTGPQPRHTATGTDLDIPKSTTVSTEEELETVFKEALSSDGPWFIVAKIEDVEPLPVSPIEPEVNLHKFRQTFIGPPIRLGQ
ncbi:MAG: sulfopyruvate decarboxylase subunit beta [Dehalococcoidia bacterium]|nr:sulfopyruvate decarboxylase subunit beta [Dehalococcoidia bacterium]